jgi:superfamily I DNA and/or RNA helicase
MWWVRYPEDDAEVKRPGSTSYANPAEVRVALDAARALQCSGRSVLVITFYRGQDVALRRAMEEAGMLERVSSNNERGADADAGGGGDSLRVLTVDQAQGSEADVVILSCVRSNEKRAIGFVANPNRMNVAISRARERLVVIGDDATLCTDAKWRALRARCQMVASPDDLPPMTHQERPAGSASVSLEAALQRMYV